MADYAKRACTDCGIRLPQPEMHRLIVRDIGVHGNYLAPRKRWFCDACAAPELARIEREAMYMREREQQEELERQRVKADYLAKKQAWAEEQERRRLANLAHKQATKED